MSRRSHREGKARAGSKVTKERVGLVVLGALLAASLIVIYRVSFENFWTNRRLQTLKEETEALKRNCSDKPSPVCDEAWERHGEKCYYFSTFKSSWDIGRRFCKEFGADLVKIDSEEEQVNDTQTSPLPHVSAVCTYVTSVSTLQRFLLNKVKDIMTEEEDKFWIGLTDSKTEGKWVLQFWWNDSKPIEPDNWPGEDPDGEDCVRMGELGPVTKLNRWLDKSCKVAQRSICEKPAKRRQ